jgi:hypothetical protein
MIRDLSIDPDQQDRFVVDDGGQPILTTIEEKALRTCSARAGFQVQLLCNCYPDWTPTPPAPRPPKASPTYWRRPPVAPT